MQIASGIDMKMVSHKYYKECRFPAEKGNPINPIDWSSIFISSLPAGFDNVDKLAHLIEVVLQLGSVKRIDYAKHATTGKPLAFIHFNYWNNSQDNHKFRHDMETLEYVDLVGTRTFFTSSIAANLYNNSNTDSYRTLNTYFHDVPNTTFIRMMINKSPISDTVLNIHQIASNADELNKTVIQLSEKVHSLSSENQTLTDKLDAVIIENKLFKQQLQSIMKMINPIKPTLQRHSYYECCPSLSLDDLVSVTLDDDADKEKYETIELIGLDLDHGDHDDDDTKTIETIDNIEDPETAIINAASLNIRRAATKHFREYNNCYCKIEHVTKHTCNRCDFEEYCHNNDIHDQVLTDVLSTMIFEREEKDIPHNEHCDIPKSLLLFSPNNTNIVDPLTPDELVAFWKIKHSIMK